MTHEVQDLHCIDEQTVTVVAAVDRLEASVGRHAVDAAVDDNVGAADDAGAAVVVDVDVDADGGGDAAGSDDSHVDLSLYKYNLLACCWTLLSALRCPFFF